MKRIIAIVISCAFVILVGLSLYHKRPIFRSDSFTASATNTNGNSYAVTVYKPILQPNRLHINIPEVENALYRWFAIDLNLKFVGIGNCPRKRLPGIYLVQNDMGSMGVGLLNPKIEDKWAVAFTPTDISFSNSWLNVKIRKN